MTSFLTTNKHKWPQKLDSLMIDLEKKNINDSQTIKILQFKNEN